MMSKNFPLLFLIALCALLPLWFIGGALAASQAAIRYVATTGSDSGNCSSPVSPCATVQYAHDQATAGDTIQIAAGTYVGAVSIDRSITLEGAGAAATILDGNQATYAIIMTETNNQLTIRKLTVRNGRFGVVSGGHTLIEEAIIRDNQPPAGNHGGGVWIWGPTTIRYTSVFSNAGLYGGGIDVRGPLTVSHSVIYNNLAEENGGGVYLGSGAVVLVENSTVSGNQSAFSGGVHLDASGAQLTLRNATVTANVADSSNSVGGVGSANGATVTLRHSVIANNLADNQCGNVGTWQSQGYNIASDNTCHLTGTGDLPNTNPLLGPLADNGGPTLTHAIGPTSPAVDAGDNDTCPATDQRGRIRPYDGNNSGTATCDIGAYEYGSTDTPPPPQTTRYVAVTGSDSGNNCLEEANPCRTIQHAVNQAFLGETVQIAAGTYVENVIVAKSITMQGTGAATTIIDGGGAARVIDMEYSPFYDLVIRDLSLRNGRGGIRAGGGSLLLENSRIYDNDTSEEWHKNGGGLLAWGPTTIANSSIYANAGQYGGGVYAGAPLTLTHSAVYNNQASQDGGGLEISINGGGAVTALNSTISGNQAAGYGGGVNVGSDGVTLLLHHATIAYNVAGAASGASGIFNTAGTTITLRNSLIAHNLGAPQCHANVGAYLSQGNNLASDGSCALMQPNDQPNTVPFLGPLQDNGGPTWSHALLQGSPAVDAANGAHCLATDQRGAARPFGPACDIGSYEADGTEPIGIQNQLYLPFIIR